MQVLKCIIKCTDKLNREVYGLLYVGVLGRPFVKRYALRYRTVVLSVLPVCPICDVGVLWPNVEWITMKLGAQQGLDSGHIVLGGDARPAPMGHSQCAK